MLPMYRRIVEGAREFFVGVGLGMVLGSKWAGAVGFADAHPSRKVRGEDGAPGFVCVQEWLGEVVGVEGGEFAA